MDTDEHLIVGPNGLQLIDAELDVLRNEFAEWQERNPGEAMPIADYASKFFFAVNCSPDAVEEEDCNNATGGDEALYPDLSTSKLGPAPVIMSAGAAGRPLPVLNRASASGLPVLERIAGDAVVGRQQYHTLPVLEHITKASPAMIGDIYDADKKTLRKWPTVEDTAHSSRSDEVFSLLRKFHELSGAVIEYKVVFYAADSNRGASVHRLTDGFYIEYEDMDQRIVLHLGDDMTSFSVQGTNSRAIKLYEDLSEAGSFSNSNPDAGNLLELLEEISGYLGEGTPYDTYEDNYNTDGSVEYTLRTRGGSAQSMVGMPTLERISAKATAPSFGMPTLERIPTKAATPSFGMPALERIPTKAAMPTLERISRSAFTDRSRLPTLERIDDNNHGVISSASLRALEASVRNYGTFGASLPAAPARKRANDVLGANRAYEDLFSDSSDSEGFDDVAAGLDTSTRAALVHSFSTVRDTFAKNKLSIANEVGASRGGLLAFVAELHDALAAVDARDANRASRVESRYLSQGALVTIACANESDSKRAAFVASAETLVDLIMDHHENDAEIRTVLVGLVVARDIFVNTMYEAWKRLINQAVKDTRGSDDAVDAYNKMARVFAAIRKRMKINERKKPRLTHDRMIVWATIGATILRVSVDELVKKIDSKEWSAELWRRVYGFRGFEEGDAEGVGRPASERVRILAEPKISGKVYMGLKIIADGALKGAGDAQLYNLAKEGTEEFVGGYFAGKDRLTKSCFMSAAAGLEILYEVSSVYDYKDVYKYYVLENLSSVRATLEQDVEG